MMAAGVAFHTHHVEAVFHTKKARKLSKNTLPPSPRAARLSMRSKGTRPTKTNGTMPQVGHAAVSKPPLNKASMILEKRWPRFPSFTELFLFFCLFMTNFQNFGQSYAFLAYLCAKFHPMKRTYQVAGHKFAVVMPDNHLAWNEMRSYEPFLSEDSEDLIFTVEMIDLMPDTSAKQKVTVSCESPDEARIELYECDGKWLLEIAPALEAPVRVFLLTDKDFRQARFRILGSMRFSIGAVLMLMFAFATAQKNTLLMHSSVTVKDGKGYLFLGKSGTGKSTHSQLWINNIEGCELLNDDNPVLRVEDNGEVRVYGSPWSGKTPCYRNLDYPVGAIVDLHQAKTNRIQRLPIVLAYAAMYVSYSGYRFIKEMADGLHATNEKIVGVVPCYSLDCLPNAEAAFLCYQTIAQ